MLEMCLDWSLHLFIHLFTDNLLSFIYWFLCSYNKAIMAFFLHRTRN